MKIYRNLENGKLTTTAKIAMAWHRAGIEVGVWDNQGHHIINIRGKSQPKKEDENRRRCQHIAEELENYVAGNVYRCPECNEIITPPDDCEKYRCPDCGNVATLDEYEPLSVWDFLDDCLDIEYRMSSHHELRSVQIMVACGGPNIYIDTASQKVELYWWRDRADYPISGAACDELDDWARVCFEC